MVGETSQLNWRCQEKVMKHMYVRIILFVNTDRPDKPLLSRRLLSGPNYFYFSLLLFCAPTFPYLFSENVLLSLLVRPKMFEVTKIVFFFFFHPRFSRSVDKNQIILIWAATLLKFIKYFYFSCNSFLGTFILLFPFHVNAELLFRENLFAYYIFLEVWKHSEHSCYPYFSCLKFLLLPSFFKILSPTLSILFQWRALESLVQRYIYMWHSQIWINIQYIFIPFWK